MRAALLKQAIEAGKHVYCEKPVSETLEEALAVARLARQRGVKNGVVQDKLFPARAAKASRCCGMPVSSAASSSVRGEFGYWVFEGDGQPAQRP